MIFFYFRQSLHEKMKSVVRRMSALELLLNQNQQVYALWVAIPRLSLLPIHLSTPDIVEAKIPRRL